MVIYQAASVVAHSVRNNTKPPLEALETLASNPQEAQIALAHFGATRYARDLPQIGQVHQQSGQTIVLYKVPMPSEQQAKLSYEYLLSEFNAYLRRKISAVVMSESDAHVALWLPEGARLEINQTWQTFIEEITDSEGFTRAFVLAINAYKLADGAGFSTLKLPVISKAQAIGVASFYYLGIQKSVQKYHQDLADQKKLQHELKIGEVKDFKKAEEDLNKVSKKLNDYLSGFERLFRVSIVELSNPEATRFARKLYKIGKRKPHLMFACLPYLLEKKQFDAIRFLSKQFSNIAREQLNSSRADILRKIFREMIKLLHLNGGEYQLTPLLSLEAYKQTQIRPSGDNTKAACYSCGRSFLEGESTYPTFRLLFQKPDQRPQSAKSDAESQKPIVCGTCAALSIMCPVKFAPDTLVIRFGKQGVEQRVRYALEQQALNEIGAVAGRYINLSCTEFEGRGSSRKSARDRLGLKQYAYAKLASLVAPNVLESLRAHLYIGGTEIELRPSVLVATSCLMSYYRQSILVQDNHQNDNPTIINLNALGRAIRYLEANDIFSAMYQLNKYSDIYKSQSAYVATSATLDEIVERYCKLLKEEDLYMANFTRDVQGLIGFLLPACNQIFAMNIEKACKESGQGLNTMQELKQWKEREIGKLIQQVGKGNSEEPTTFTYSTFYSVGHLKRNENTRFAYSEARRLIEELKKDGVIDDSDLGAIFVEIDNLPAIRINGDLIAAVFALLKDRYKTDFERKRFFYHVKLGLFSRFKPTSQDKED